MRYFDPFLALDEFACGLLSVSPVFSMICNFAMASSCFFVCFFDYWWFLDILAVSAPAGFPDHPHRGLFLVLSVSILSFSWENFTLVYSDSSVLLFRFWDSHLHVTGMRSRWSQYLLKFISRQPNRTRKTRKIRIFFSK